MGLYTVKSRKMQPRHWVASDSLKWNKMSLLVSVIRWCNSLFTDWIRDDSCRWSAKRNRVWWLCRHLALKKKNTLRFFVDTSDWLSCRSLWNAPFWLAASTCDTIRRLCCRWRSRRAVAASASRYSFLICKWKSILLNRSRGVSFTYSWCSVDYYFFCLAQNCTSVQCSLFVQYLLCSPV